MKQIIGILFWWALIGYFICGAIPKPTDKKSALKQLLWLGPIFWVGVGIWGLCILVKRKILS